MNFLFRLESFYSGAIRPTVQECQLRGGSCIVSNKCDIYAGRSDMCGPGIDCCVAGKTINSFWYSNFSEPDYVVFCSFVDSLWIILLQRLFGFLYGRLSPDFPSIACQRLRQSDVLCLPLSKFNRFHVNPSKLNTQKHIRMSYIRLTNRHVVDARTTLEMNAVATS